MPSYAIGFEDGEARGEAQTQREIVLRLLQRFDAAEVADLLGMAVDEVQRVAAAPADDRETMR